MSSINERMVREFFELLGFFVYQPCKYAIPGRPKTPEEEVDLLVFRPGCAEFRLPNRLVWNARDFRSVSRAVVSVRGWHSERFSLSRLLNMPEILRFAEAESLRAAAHWLGEGPVAKVLCLPQLPASEALKEKTLALLQERGVDGVLTFPVLVRELAIRVKVNRNYEKSDVLQMLRILKAYGFLTTDKQLPLFGGRFRRVLGANPEKNGETQEMAKQATARPDDGLET